MIYYTYNLKTKEFFKCQTLRTKVYTPLESNIFIICHENEYDKNIDSYLINRAELYNVLHDKKVATTKCSILPIQTIVEDGQEVVNITGLDRTWIINNVDTPVIETIILSTQKSNTSTAKIHPIFGLLDKYNSDHNTDYKLGYNVNTKEFVTVI